MIVVWYGMEWTRLRLMMGGGGGCGGGTCCTGVLH